MACSLGAWPQSLESCPPSTAVMLGTGRHSREAGIQRVVHAKRSYLPRPPAGEDARRAGGGARRPREAQTPIRGELVERWTQCQKLLMTCGVTILLRRKKTSPTFAQNVAIARFTVRPSRSPKLASAQTTNRRITQVRDVFTPIFGGAYTGTRSDKCLIAA